MPIIYLQLLFLSFLSWTLASPCRDLPVLILKEFPKLADPFCTWALKIGPSTTYVATATTTVTFTKSSGLITSTSTSSPTSKPSYPPGLESLASSVISSACSCLSLPVVTISATKSVTATYSPSSSTTSSTKTSSIAISPTSTSKSSSSSTTSSSSSLFTSTTPSSSKSSLTSIPSSSSSSKPSTTSSVPASTSSQTSTTSSTSSSSSSSSKSSSTSTITTSSSSTTLMTPTTSTTLTNSTSSVSTTTTSKPSFTAPRPSCLPTFILDGVSETEFNPAYTPFSIHIACSTLNTSNIAFYVNWGLQIPDVPGSTTSVNSTTISFHNGLTGAVLLSIFATDVNGYPFLGNFHLLFGGIRMPITVVDGITGLPVAGALVTANATVYSGVSQSGYTDENGQLDFVNLFPTTIALVAKASGNRVGIQGLAAQLGSVTLGLIPYGTPSNVTNYDFSFGTTGWSNGTLVPHVESQGNESAITFYDTEFNYNNTNPIPIITTTTGSVSGPPTTGVSIGIAAKVQATAVATSEIPRRIRGAVSGSQSGTTSFTKRTITKRLIDQDLYVSTGGGYNLVTSSSTFNTYSFTKTVFIRYKFQTDEIPGGYYGTQYNDYYSITIRSDVGGYATITHSMNELGLGAFDASGTTDWLQLTLDVPSTCKSVQFDIGVSNVVDNLFDSAIIVDKAGDLNCDTCGDCANCPGDPMCQATCQSPPPQSCAFYSNCVDATKSCAGDPQEYAINYGLKYCSRYADNIHYFDGPGQAWVWNVMSCLQNALVPVMANCDVTCGQIHDLAFASHPACYVNNGFCGLSCQDYVAVMGTVGWGLFGWDATGQILQTAKLCAGQLTTTLQGCAGQVAVDVALLALLAASVL